jgi:hypothetical protein
MAALKTAGLWSTDAMLSGALSRPQIFIKGRRLSMPLAYGGSGKACGMSLNSITERAPGAGQLPSVGWTVVALAAWGVIYSQLIPFSDWVVARPGVDPSSHLGGQSVSSPTTRRRF